MTVTYKITSMGLKVPVLHKVIYAHDLGMPAEYQRSYQDHLVDEWLKENCKHPYYRSPGYLPEKSIQFECERDATWFALRWA